MQAPRAVIAQALDKKLNPALHTLTLITDRDYYMHFPAALRMLASPDGNIFKDAVLPLDNLFGIGTSTSKFGKIVYGKVERVEENPEGKGGQAVLATGTKLLGTSWSSQQEANGLELSTSLMEKPSSPSELTNGTGRLPGRRVFSFGESYQWSGVQ